MIHDINPAKVDFAVRELLREVNGLPYGEALLAMSQALGRLIVEVCDNHIQMRDMVKVCEGHLIDTITIGAKAKGT